VRKYRLTSCRTRCYALSDVTWGMGHLLIYVHYGETHDMCIWAVRRPAAPAARPVRRPARERRTANELVSIPVGSDVSPCRPMFPCRTCRHTLSLTPTSPSNSPLPRTAIQGVPANWQVATLACRSEFYKSLLLLPGTKVTTPPDMMD